MSNKDEYRRVNFPEICAIAEDLIAHFPEETEITPKMREDACLRLKYQNRRWIERPDKAQVVLIYRKHFATPIPQIPLPEALEQMLARVWHGRDLEQLTMLEGKIFDRLQAADFMRMKDGYIYSTSPKEPPSPE